MRAPRQITTVSAPGKVLVAGGYLVLDPQYSGVVVATTSRFFSSVRTLSSHDGLGPSLGQTNTDVDIPSSESGQVGLRWCVRVTSPQFEGAVWTYIVSQVRREGKVTDWKIVQDQSSDLPGSNPFVQLAILHSLRLASELSSHAKVARLLGGYGLGVTVLGDNDFYSQRAKLAERSLPLSSDSLLSLSSFDPLGLPISQVHKTGLGSSAAMTTSLVGALLIHLGVVPLQYVPAYYASSTPSQPEYNTAFGSIDTPSIPRPNKLGQPTEAGLALIHNLAQFVHCSAQGKIGSGFDVSSAVWGSHIFQRGGWGEVLGQLMAHDDGDESAPAPSLLPSLNPVHPCWAPADSTRPSDSEPGSLSRPSPLSLPPFLSLLLADVDTGSNTPKLVSSVLAWRKEKPEEAGRVYASLDESNGMLVSALGKLNVAYVQSPDAYKSVISRAEACKNAEWDVFAAAIEQEENKGAKEVWRGLIALKDALKAIRADMKCLGTSCGAPIEPDEQTRLLDASVEVEGVAGGGVPGAGGYDALYLLVLSPPSPSADADSNDAPRSIPRAQRAVEQLWSQWQEMSVCALTSRAEAGVGASSVGHGRKGISLEAADKVEGLDRWLGLQ